MLSTGLIDVQMTVDGGTWRYNRQGYVNFVFKSPVQELSPAASVTRL